MSAYPNVCDIIVKLSTSSLTEGGSVADEPFGYMRNLPEDIRDIFMWLCQDVASLSRKWRLYLELFGKEENAGLLSDTAGAAFNVIEESVRIDMAMLICRLSDGPGSRGKENLNFSNLEEFYDTDEELKGLIKLFRKACEHIRLHRNKLIGHSDLSTRLKPDENLLPPVGRSDVEEIVERAVETLRHVAMKYAGPDLSFSTPTIMGADALIWWLRRGWDAEKANK
jgi:hypothetical protein